MIETSRIKSGGHMIDVLFTLALFCVFAASSLLVVLIGANVYSSTVETMDRNFETNTSLSYVSTKIRQHDAAGAVYIDAFAGADALVLEQEADGTVYQTWIYYHDGSLCELLTQKEYIDTMEPASGQPILAVERFTFSDTGDGLIRLHSESDDSTADLFIGLRS